jgi:acetylornithine deacetylase/succinyl-diaminopimelate desuccinylase-like protein
VKELHDEGRLDHLNICFIIEGEEEAHSTGLEDVVAKTRDWICLGSRVAGILISNNYWVGESVPCLTYGMRGIVEVNVNVRGPSKDLHSGVDGGAVFEPLLDLVAVVSTLVNSNGRIAVPGFYDGVPRLSPEEKAIFDAIELDMDQYMRVLGVTQLTASTPSAVLDARWRQPTLSVLHIDTSVTAHHAHHGESKSACSKHHRASMKVESDDEPVTPSWEWGNAATHHSLPRCGGMSVIPKSASAVISIRFVPNQKAEELVRKLEGHLKHEFAKRQSPNTLSFALTKQGEWWLGDRSNELYSNAHTAIQRVWKQEPLYVREGGTMPLTPILERLLDAPAIHIPLGQCSDGAHLPNERIKAENLIQGKNVLREFIALFKP